MNARKPVPIHPAPVDEYLLTLAEVADRLKVSRRQVGNFLTRRDHPLPAVRLGRRAVRVRPATLAAWVAEEEADS